MALEDRDDLTATEDHAVVRDLVEEYDGYPAHVERTESGAGGSGLLRLAFPDVASRDDDPNEDLTRLSWEEFFEEFDQEHLALVYPEDLGDDAAADFQLLERDRVEDAGIEV